MKIVTIKELYSRHVMLYHETKLGKSGLCVVPPMEYYKFIIKCKLLFNIDVEKYSTIKPYHGTIFKFSTEDGITQSHDLYYFDLKYSDENIQTEFDETEIPKKFNMDGFNVIITWLMVLMSLSVSLGLVFASLCILITGLVGNIMLLAARDNTFLKKAYFKRINKKIDREYALLLDKISLDLAYDNGIDLDVQKDQLKKYGLLYLKQY